MSVAMVNEPPSDDLSSGVSIARVRLDCDPGQLKLEVSDDGHGIQDQNLQRVHESSGNAGVGIASMRERVRQLGWQAGDSVRQKRHNRDCRSPAKEGTSVTG